MDTQDSDSWYGIQDARERKKIQNRHAQRARRQRLATKKHGDTPNAVNSVSSSCQSVDRSPMSFAAFAAIVPSTKSSSDAVICQLPTAVFTAMYNNGAMMGLSCGTVIPAKSSPQPDHIPLPLHPTAIQLTTLHPIWIDRLPFPKMRDNLITLQGIIEDEEILKDMFNMESFSIKEKGNGWDPRDWMVGKAFAEKWGYLFY